MCEDAIHIPLEDIEVVDTSDYSYDVEAQFTTMTESAKPWVKYAKRAFSKVEMILYSSSAFADMIKKSIPQQMLRALLTDEQKSRLADGTLKLMTKKDGSLMATLVNPETSKIVATVPLESVNISPALTEAVTNYATQMQMAQIAEQIQEVQGAIEEVRQGQEYDRLAMAYSCKQKLLQAMQIRNPELKERALLQIASDAEDSRNLLMQSQNANLLFIKEQPESVIGKLIYGAKTDKINQRMSEIRESLSAVNMVSLAEAMAYQELGETSAARQSLLYYAEYIDKTYLKSKGLVQRLDMIDPAPENYWTNTLPNIREKIQKLPCVADVTLLIGDDADGE